MKRRIILSIIIIVGILSGFAKDEKNVEGKATFCIPSNMTIGQAREAVVNQAIIDALNNTFGNTIGASNTMILTEKNEYFYSNAYNFVRGEWVETIGEPEVVPYIENGQFWFSCNIKGKAREKKSANAELYAVPLRNGTTIEYESTDFKNGNNLFMLFKAPIDGYVAIYLHDHTVDKVYCLLPYAKQGVGSIPVVHDKEYLFFSKTDSDTPTLVDQYTLYCKEDFEINSIYVLFSPNQFVKPLSGVTGKLEPRNLSFKDFVDWKENCQAHDNSFQTLTFDLSIRK